MLLSHSLDTGVNFDAPNIPLRLSSPEELPPQLLNQAIIYGEKNPVGDANAVCGMAENPLTLP